MFAAVHPRPLVSPSSRDLCGRRLPGLPRASREPGRDVSAVDCSFSFTLSNLHLSTFNFQTCSNSFPYLVTSLLPSFLFLKPFSCNTYGSPRKCCKQKTYALAKPFRCNTYKKHEVGVSYPFWNLPPSLHFPFFSPTYVEPILQPLCFDGFPSNGGVWGGIDNENSQERFLSRGSIETEEPLLFSNEDSCPQQHRDEAISVPPASEHGSRFSFAPYFVTSLPIACCLPHRERKRGATG